MYKERRKQQAAHCEDCTVLFEDEERLICANDGMDRQHRLAAVVNEP